MATDLVINKFDEGIADSPETGFADIRNLDIYSNPGGVRSKPRTNKDSSTTITDVIKWIVVDPTTGYRYALGDAGKVYTNSSGSWAVIAGNTTTNAHGNGLLYWKGHILVARDTVIDAYKIASTTWYSAIATITSDTLWHPMLAGQDDMVYGGAGRYIFSFAEVGTFDASNSATWTFNASALDLPQNYRVKCLEELGTNLMIGTWQGVNVYDVKVADIFPWDRTSASFGLPIRLNEGGIHQMKNINNILWITAGTQGSIYTTNGSTTSLIRKLPLYARYNESYYLEFYPGACMQYNDRYLFGVSRGTGDSNVTAAGLYSVSPEGKLVFENQISTGTANHNNAFVIGALHATNNAIYIGWRDDSTYGIDLTDSSNNRYASYASYFDTALYQVGTPKNKRRFRVAQIQLDRALASGSGVKIQYRYSLNDSFTTLDTIDYATYGAVQSYQTGAASMGRIENVQFRISITEGTSNPIVLKEVRFK